MINYTKFAALWMKFQTYSKPPQADDPPLPLSAKKRPTLLLIQWLVVTRTRVARMGWRINHKKN